MMIKALQVGMVGTNCYLVVNENTNEAVVIDPGDEASRIISRLDEIGAEAKAVFLTHGHFDHVMAAGEIADHYGIEIYIHEDDMELVKDPVKNAGGMIGLRTGFRADKTFAEGETLSFAGMNFKTIHTPGHTPGGACFYLEDEGILFCGDTLFCGSVGRTDLPGGSESTLIRSIREKLIKLPDSVVCYPGHGEATKISYEKIYNPFI